MNYFTRDTKVFDVINDEFLKGFGRMIFPLNRNIPQSMTLNDVGDIYVWYNHISPDKTVEIINYMKNESDKGNRIFYDIYTDDEKKTNPSLSNTGLFFFKGNSNSKFAVINAGGGMVYVGAMQDSFPQALELSKKGYNSFALIYRPGAHTAMQDLARAIAFIHENREELEVDVDDYSVWGGSAGARMAAWISTYGTEQFSSKRYPRPSAVIMQYTGLSEVTGLEVPTYSCVGTRDYIADYRVMEDRINRIKSNGTDAMIEVFNGLPHGFGLGEGTIAEGWIDNAVRFWESNMKK